ncbi:MAG: hypothetical protein ABIR16_05575 [Dokdonella sp.]
MIAVARQTGETQHSDQVLRLGDIDHKAIAALLARHGLNLITVADSAAIPGSYWGEPEAGVIADCVFARADTPVHSILHEASHLIVAGPERRAAIHTDASVCDREEDATCYLQIVLADALPGVGRDRLMTDMDRWGYSFRLGSTRAWFEQDADDAHDWLLQRRLLSSSSDHSGAQTTIRAAPNLAAGGGRV